MAQGAHHGAFGDAYPTRRKKGSRTAGEDEVRSRLAMALLGLVACTPEAPPSSVILNAELREAHQGAAQALAKPRTPLRFADGGAATNCADYLKLVAKRDLEEAPDNFAVRSEYLVCDALGALGGKPVGEVQAVGKAYGPKLANRLDWRSFPSSIFNRADEGKHSLQGLFTHQLRTSGNVAEVETNDWHYRLEPVAIAQVDNNPTADWIVWLTDEARDGTYRSFRTLVVHDPAPQGPLLGKVLN